jgi:hypothetical protein
LGRSLWLEPGFWLILELPLPGFWLIPELVLAGLRNFLSAFPFVEIQQHDKDF